MAKKKDAINNKIDNSSDKQKKRSKRSNKWVSMPFEQAYEIAKAIQKFASGQKVRRLTLLDQMGRSPSSGPVRSMITNASKYELISGNYNSEHLELTDLGQKATADSTPPKIRQHALIDSAIGSQAPFDKLHTQYTNNKLPSTAIMVDLLKDSDIEERDAASLVDLFILNAQHVGILVELAGAERIISTEHAIENLPQSQDVEPSIGVAVNNVEDLSNGQSTIFTSQNDGDKSITDSGEIYESSCFYVTPIGADDSEERQHADLFLNQIVEPALAEFDLNIVRADTIQTSGIITNQIIKYLLFSKLVIVDLSFNNPNVFYELAIRHATRKPTVQIMRKGDKIPFDINQVRTIIIDNSSIYTLLPKLKIHQASIASQIRQALEEPTSNDNPLSALYPNLKLRTK